MTGEAERRRVVVPAPSLRKTSWPHQDSSAQSSGRTFHLAFGHGNGRHKRWKPREPKTWPEFVEWLNLDEPGRNKESGAYVMGQLSGVGPRNSETVLSRSAFTGDADSLTAEQARDLVEAVKAQGWLAVIHETWSSTPEKPRYRLVIAYARDLTPAEHRRVSRWVIRSLGVPVEAWDVKASTSPVQLMQRPSRSIGADWAPHVWVLEGEPIDVERALSEEPEVDGDVRPRSGGTESAGHHTAGGGRGRYAAHRRYDGHKLNARELAYLSATLRNAERQLKEAAPGSRNNVLNTLTFRLARLVAGGGLSERSARGAMTRAGIAAGLTADEVRSTVDSAMAAGLSVPRAIPLHPGDRAKLRRLFGEEGSA